MENKNDQKNARKPRKKNGGKKRRTKIRVKTEDEWNREMDKIPDDTRELNPDTKEYKVLLQPRHWRFAEAKAESLGMTMQHYLEWLVRRDHQTDPSRRAEANSRTISGEPLPGNVIDV